MDKSIELEYRACIREKDFVYLQNFLSRNGKVIGNDNKDTYFFIWKDKVVKVVFNKESGNAKISLKPGRIGKQDHFNEVEFKIDINDVEKAIELFKILDPEDTQYTYQFRVNYEYNGVEIALKYTQSWGFHLELEIMLDSIKKKNIAINKIFEVAKELGVTIMTNKELSEYTAKIDLGHNFGNYTKENFPYYNYQ